MRKDRINTSGLLPEVSLSRASIFLTNCIAKRSRTTQMITPIKYLNNILTSCLTKKFAVTTIEYHILKIM